MMIRITHDGVCSSIVVTTIVQRCNLHEIDQGRRVAVITGRGGQYRKIGWADWRAVWPQAEFLLTRACARKSGILDAACSMSALHPRATE
jgi:hypothetical protein